MFNCPYCGSRMEHPKPEHLPMSQKRRAVYDEIVKAGPRGIPKQELIDRFFSACGSETILRTTIHYVNKVIAPQKIYSRGGIVRLARND